MAHIIGKDTMQQFVKPRVQAHAIKLTISISSLESQARLHATDKTTEAQVVRLRVLSYQNVSSDNYIISFEPPKCSQESPRVFQSIKSETQRAPWWPPGAPRGSQQAPKEAQAAPKDSPRGPKKLPKGNQNR